MKRVAVQILFILSFTALSPKLWAQSETTDPVSQEGVQTKPKGFTISGSSGVNISGPTTICKGGETLLKAEGDYESFEWNTGVKDRLLRVREEGTYEVTVTTKGGCRFTTSVTVRMIPCT